MQNGWMILLIKEKDLGQGCASCRFLNTLKTTAECTVDERVCVYDKGKIDQYRPYTCPFRYYSSEIKPVCKQFEGMTEDETTGFIKGADSEHKKFIVLEEHRDKYTEAKYKSLMDDEI